MGVTTVSRGLPVSDPIALSQEYGESVQSQQMEENGTYSRRA